MRSDIAKVFFEESKNSTKREKLVKKGRSLSDMEDYPKTEGMKAIKRRGYNTAYMRNWSTGVILRYLKKNVGKKWDDVWHNICEATKSNKKPDIDVRNYILNQVNNTIIYDEENGLYKKMGARYHLHGDVFYIDEKGFLKILKKKQKSKIKKKKDYITLDNGNILKKENDIWFCFEYEDFNIEELNFEQKMEYMFKKQKSPFNTEKVLKRKRTLSKGEIRAFGLNKEVNDNE